MGASYINTVVKGPSQQEVLDYLNKAKIKAYVSASSNGYTVVFDELSDTPWLTNENYIKTFPEKLSRELKCVALTVAVYDSDVLVYWLRNNGELVDQFDSHPNSSKTDEAGPKGGDVKVLAETLNREADQAQLKSIIHEKWNTLEDRTYGLVEHRHADLVKLFGMPEVAISNGYRYVDEEMDETNKSSEFEDVVHTERRV